MDNEKNTRRYGRRELLKLGAAASLAVPVVMTLAPKEARAQGSWSNAKKDDWRANTRDSFEMKGQASRDANQSYVFPGSYQWREQRQQEEERRRRMRGEFN